jgi:hypothetical protein
MRFETSRPFSRATPHGSHVQSRDGSVGVTAHGARPVIAIGLLRLPSMSVQRTSQTFAVAFQRNDPLAGRPIAQAPPAAVACFPMRHPTADRLVDSKRGPRNDDDDIGKRLDELRASAIPILTRRQRERCHG